MLHHILHLAGALLGRLSPDLAARLARYVATRPMHRSRRPEPVGAVPVSFRFGLAGLRWGEGGPRVLALHGWEGRAAQFRRLGEALAARGYQLVALDAPAHGRSPGTDADPVVFADALSEAAAELGPLHAVIGHSMGGASALLALAGGLRAERAVVIAAPAAFAPVLLGIGRRLGLPGTAMNRFLELMERRTGRPLSALDIESFAPDLAGPRLVVHDREDRVIPFEHAARIARRLGASLLETSGLGHRDILRAEPVVDRVAGFLTAPS